MTERIRVLVFVSGFAIGQPLGGAERFGVELARHLDLARFEPVVCGFWRRNVPAEDHWRGVLAADGIEAFEAVERGRGFSPWRLAQALRNISSHLAGRPVDVIHSHFQLGSITAILLRRRLGAKALARTAHGTVPWEWSNTPRGFICRQIFTQWLFPLAFDVETGVSQAVVDSLDRRPGAWISRKHARRYYNGIDVHPFARATPQTTPSGADADREQTTLRSRLGLGLGDCVIGSVGRLSEQKGYTYLLEAASAVLAQHPQVKFLLVGDGELRSELQQQAAALGLTGSVIFAGAQESTVDFYRVMDVFVLPSLWEGLPTVVLESMASGVPVVATDIPGTQELVEAGHTGWLCRPRDPVSLAETLLSALSNPLLGSAMAATARERVLACYSLNAIAKQFEILYQHLIAPRGDHGRPPWEHTS
jgi:glycosyltransferase involved in cell wall biosynthesis